MRSLTLLGPFLVSVLLPSFSDAHTCRCRNRGVMFELGETSCLHVDGRNYLARCEMKLNLSSWTEIEDGCPVTEAPAQSPVAIN